jgi:hypothetical protein
MKILRRSAEKADAPAAAVCIALNTHANLEVILPMLKTTVIGGTASAAHATVVANVTLHRLTASWGAKVFLGAVVVLISAMRHGATPKRMAQLRELVGVSRRTVERWREWWRNGFVRSPFWKAARGLLRAPIDENILPLSLLNSFPGQSEKERLIGFLSFILPLTSSLLAQGFQWPLPIRRRCQSR